MRRTDRFCCFFAFRSTSKSFTLQAVPDLSEEFGAKAAGMTGRLTGDPSFRFGEEDEDADEEEEEEGAPKKEKFSEVHRLALTIASIDAETAVVPRGAYIVTATHDVRPNTAFEGLDKTSAASLSNYYHFREPVELARKSVLDREGMVASTDFLDPLAEDSPKGIWGVRVDEARGVATLRSLAWPGYFFYHALGSGSFGGAYFGYGQKNGDIGFMV